MAPKGKNKTPTDKLPTAPKTTKSPFTASTKPAQPPKGKAAKTTEKKVPKTTKGQSTASTKPAQLPKGLPKGLLNGRDDDPLVATANVLQQFVCALQGQNQHNVATTTALRDHRQTLTNHGEQLKSNGDTLTSIDTRVKSNTDSITSQNKTLECHGKSIETMTQNVNTLKQETEDAHKAMETKIVANTTTLESHKNWQNSYTKLNGLLMSSNEKSVLALKGRCAILEQQHVGHDERLDNHALALETLGKKADTQETAIETNRAGVISNAEAINAIRLDMAVELEEKDERLNRIETTQEHQQNIHEIFAGTCQKLESLFGELFVKTKGLNTEIEKEKYDPEELYAQLPPPQQASYRKNRRKTRKRNREFSTVPIPATYKKSKLTEDNKWTLVQTEAASAATRAALYAAAKDSAAKRVEEANKALADHESKEERLREEAKEQEKEEERRRAEEEEREPDVLGESNLPPAVTPN
jgi:hypothetical protein